MLQLHAKNIISITAARQQLDDLVDKAKGNNFFAISRQGKPDAALINLDYLMGMQNRLDQFEFERALEGSREGFRQYLIKIGKNPDTISDEEAENILYELGKKPTGGD
jgi:PHD/YefM family antitoxin component YafN of YafNO toxin-antitoxin module